MGRFFVQDMLRIGSQSYNVLPARGDAGTSGTRVEFAPPLRGFIERFANPYEECRGDGYVDLLPVRRFTNQGAHLPR